MVPLGFVGFVLVGLDGLRAHHNGIPGTLTVADCEWHQLRGGGKWDCSGPFISDDHTVQINRIELTEGDHRATGEHVSVLVSGPGAVNAWPTADRTWWMVPILVLLSCLIPGALGMWLYGGRLAGLMHVLRHGRRPMRAAPEAIAGPSGRVPQLGNRARRRRRKHR
jgi:hypothetical protein